MADLKITELGTAGALDGSELVEVVQSGGNVKTTTQDIADLGGGGGAVSSVNGQTGVVVLDAADIASTPSGGISASNVQSAINELDSEIDSRIAASIAGFKWKTSVRVATTVAGTLATSFENGDTVDGVVLATGDRMLMKNQASAIDNGIRIIAASGAPARATDADTATELEGAAVTVQEGTTNANTTWLQITDNITLGVSNIVFTQLGTSVVDADATTKGIAKLYPSTSLGSNTDGAPDQNAVKVYVDAKVVDAINDSATTTAPSQNAVFDALALKQVTLTAANFGDFLVALTGKTTPVDADVITLSDSAASDDAKKVTLTNFKAFLKTYFDGLYVGVEDLYVRAAAMTPRVTAGCSPLAQTEMTTSLFNITTLDFNQTTQQFAQFELAPPRNWNNGTITAVFYWTAASSSGGVVWGISMGSYRDDDALTVAFGTAQTVADTLLATNDLHITSATSAITAAGTVQDGNLLAIQISRNPADGSDTLAADAKLLGVSLRFTFDAGVSA